MKLMASEVATVTDGRLAGPDVALTGVSIDSRTIAAGEMFVALMAERNGNVFIPDALRAGAVAYMTAQPNLDAALTTVTLSDAVTTDAVLPVISTAIIVADTAVALTKLGSHARSRFLGPVVGITGSVGKTSVKDMAAAVIGTQRPTHASLRSFNNELGVPLTLINTPDISEVVVVEMGARGKGHIAELCSQARPTVGVVTAVGAAHIELFGSIKAVAEAKGEMVECLSEDGVAVLNADQPLVAAMAARTSAQVLTFGGTAGDVRASGVRLDEALRPSFLLETPSGQAEVRLLACGEHMVQNALAAAAIGLAVGVDIQAIAFGLAQAQLSPWRMEVAELSSGALLINDAYNANPLSMEAALRALGHLQRGRKVAVLGLMAELGERSVSDHAAIAALARELHIEVIAVGTSHYGIAPVSDLEAAVAAVGDLDSNTAVLVKGSRAVGLEQVASGLDGFS